MKRSRVLLTIATLFSMLSVGMLPSAPSAPAVPNGWSSSGDYATEELGNTWDFSTADDWDVQARYESRGISNVSISGARSSSRPARRGTS